MIQKILGQVNSKPVQMLYGPPGNFQALYGAITPTDILFSLLAKLFSPIIIAFSFIIGLILFFLTHKKVFLIIPAVYATLYLVFKITGAFFGFRP